MIDLRTRIVSLVKPPGLNAAEGVWGVAFNYAGSNRGLLAVHGRRAVGVYQGGVNSLQAIAETAVGPQTWEPWQHGRDIARMAALAWSGDGTRLIVARGAGDGADFREWRILQLTEGPSRRLETVADFDSCQLTPGGYLGFDVATLHDKLHRPTLTPTTEPTTTPTVTLAPSNTPTSTATATPPLPSASPSATPGSTPTATARPSPAYLPLTLREHCVPGQQNVDVALVIDASTSMRDGRTAAGRTKLAAAVEAAGRVRRRWRCRTTRPRSSSSTATPRSCRS